MAYYRTCLICGAALDPDERCEDCLSREETDSEAKRKQRKTALDARNIRDGRAQQVLTDAVDASSLSKE